MFRNLVLVVVLLAGFTSCAAYHDSNRVNGVFGAQGTVANTYAASDARASDASISRCDQLVAARKPGDTVQCADAAGGVYIGPAGSYGYPAVYGNGYYSGGIVVGRYTTDLEWAAAVSREYRRAQAAEESGSILINNPPVEDSK